MSKLAGNTSDSDDEIEMQIARERLRQARQSFNLALGMVTACATLGLIGVGLLWSGNVQQGKISIVGAASAVLPCLKFASQTNDRLDKILRDLRND